VKDGICPKCGQASVYEQEMGVTYRSSHGGAFVMDGTWQVAHDCDTRSYLCIRCGYFENYVDDAEMLAKIPTVKGWTLVAPNRF
jgi:predicted nucleic-acid-binding Zn-ribbon protein